MPGRPLVLLSTTTAAYPNYVEWKQSQNTRAAITSMQHAGRARVS